MLRLSAYHLIMYDLQEKHFTNSTLLMKKIGPENLNLNNFAHLSGF